MGGLFGQAGKTLGHIYTSPPERSLPHLALQLSTSLSSPFMFVVSIREQDTDLLASSRQDEDCRSPPRPRRQPVFG